MSLNAFCGVWDFSGARVDSEKLERCTFKSPLWTPDHQATRLDGSLGFTATQRFISPEDAEERMPHMDTVSGCVILADSYLVSRSELARTLGVDASRPDCELILTAYLKWGRDCVRHLHGDFGFAIWDPHAGVVFAATDLFGRRPVFYSHEPGKQFVFANTMAPFRVLCPELSGDPRLPSHFALDFRLDGITCYRQVSKILAASTIVVNSDRIKKRNYWKLASLGLSRPGWGDPTARERYYGAFRNIFDRAVEDYSRSPHPIIAHISGGLDSASVACVAAIQAQESQHVLHGFTAAPLNLHEGGFRPGWEYGEMKRVKGVLAHYPGINHFTFHTDPAADPLSELKMLEPLMDQPYRNISNLHWVQAGLRHARLLGVRIILTGSNGNAGVSWQGQSPRSMASRLYQGLKTWLRPNKVLQEYYLNHNARFLGTSRARQILRRCGVFIDTQGAMLSHRLGTPAYSGSRILSLWHGVEMMDPTSGGSVVEFCRSLPQWVFARSMEKSQRRLLIREGMAGIVPDSIRLNTLRGEQAADWYLQHNHHVDTWRHQLEDLGPGASAQLWELFDRQSMLGLFQKYAHIESPSADALHAGHLIMRCLSLGLYLDYLERNTP